MENGYDTFAAFKEVLGYLNFSSGNVDSRFLHSLDELFRHDATIAEADDSQAVALRDALLCGLKTLQSQESAFADVSQANAAITLTLDVLLPAFIEHHRDLLFHQSEASLTQPFLIGRMFESVLRQGSPWEETDRVVSGALSQLNDFIGYRPVPTVESERKIEPYSHEWVRPIPLYIEGAGVAVGKYEPLISRCLDILRNTDSSILHEAYFDLDALEELALDPRAYDFDHPVNKRPNYHFGLWDPHAIDNQGRYRRFVVQQVTLDALLNRLDLFESTRRDEALLEAATVLAGTILMASGTSGSGPDTHDSNTTLSNLLPRIAQYRDQFYEYQISQLSGELAQRMQAEATKLHQAFGGARQHLNQELARRRAIQLQKVHLAQLYARMGFPDASTNQAHSVRVPAARMLCKIYCRLTLGHRAVDQRKLKNVADYLIEIEDLLKRAIECGALVDPWNIIGFGGNFSLFPAIENSIHDYRVDTLIELMDQIFALNSRAWSDAAARDEVTLEKELADTFERLATWWDQFATPTVESVRRLVGKELQVSTNLVAGALNAWHKAGAAAGDIAFWRLFVDQFDSPKAFQLVVEALLEKGDRVASMALLMQWLSEADRHGLDDGDISFHRLAESWLTSLALKTDDETTSESIDDDTWRIAQKFFDYLEANAEAYWHVPTFDLSASANNASRGESDRELAGDEDDEEDDDGIYKAAYEQMSYRDSTDDGFDGEVFDDGATNTDYELDEEAKRLGQRLAFHTTLARLYKIAAAVFGAGTESASERRDTFAAWYQTALSNQKQLGQLLEEVFQYRITAPSGAHDSMVEYDRTRLIKEGTLERIISTAVLMSDAARTLCAASGLDPDDPEERSDTQLLQAVLSGDAEQIRQLWPSWIEALHARPILYIPLSRGGDPGPIVEARATQQLLRDLLVWLPRLGMIFETSQLLDVAQLMEADNPVGPGAVTEFDQLFEAGYRGMVQNIAASADHWIKQSDSSGRQTDFTNPLLIECLKQLAESQLKRWLDHSRTLRLSVVERLASDKQWQQLVDFIQRYGGDLFTQRFLILGNLRAILHQGVEAWLRQLEENDEEDYAQRLLDDLDGPLPREVAVKELTLIFEAIVENYSEYRDYNSTTTQSDRGDMLYTLIDFVRLRSDYDRVAWNLRPVVLAHEILVREGRLEAASLWRRELVERTSEVADRNVRRLNELSQQYGMRLPTISDRIGERFVRPLTIDRVRSLVRPAMEEAAAEEESVSFALFEPEVEELAREPTGVGFDIPTWLEALETEVAQVRSRERHSEDPSEALDRVPRVTLSIEELQDQLDAISEQDS